ncbi:MAG: DUF3299 domain-containing protein [Alphaproteobacteria bacterium]|nr:DUF3299 domain-containing protein [Alphaproteobacteria bacterium]
MFGLLKRLGLAAFLSLSAIAIANAVERVGWEDLAPAVDEKEFAFDDLNEDQIYDLYDVYRASRLAKTGALPDGLKEMADQSRARLVAKGFDVEALIKRFETMRKKLEARNRTLIRELDGKEIQIPGYALPLEFSGETITEFLLVPYVGACIHTPPPPPNQIVHVRAPKGIKSEGLFTPVWVTGRISTGVSEQSLAYVDGSAKISVGYSMDNVTVEPYEE